MNLCRCCSILFLIHSHWKLTRFSIYPVVLSLIGLSRTDWNLINLLNGFDCCGIPIVCSECILERRKDTGADVDGYLCALRTVFFCSSQIRTLRHFFCLFVLRSFFKVQPAWADTVMENGSFFVQVVFFVYKWAGSSCLTLPTPPLSPSIQRKVLFFIRSFFFLLVSAQIKSVVKHSHIIANMPCWEVCIMCKYVIYSCFLYYHAFSTKDSQGEDKSCTCRISRLFISNLLCFVNA